MALIYWTQFLADHQIRKRIPLSFHHLLPVVLLVAPGYHHLGFLQFVAKKNTTKIKLFKIIHQKCFIYNETKKSGIKRVNEWMNEWMNLEFFPLKRSLIANFNYLIEQVISIEIKQNRNEVCFSASNLHTIVETFHFRPSIIENKWWRVL